MSDLKVRPPKKESATGVAPMALWDFGHADPALTPRKESAKVKESKSERVEIGKLKLENG